MTETYELRRTDANPVGGDWLYAVDRINVTGWIWRRERRQLIGHVWAKNLDDAERGARELVKRRTFVIDDDAIGG